MKYFNNNEFQKEIDIMLQKKEGLLWEAEARGREEGREEGRILTLYTELNLTPQQIAKKTDFTVEEINKIISSQK